MMCSRIERAKRYRERNPSPAQGQGKTCNSAACARDFGGGYREVKFTSAFPLLFAGMFLFLLIQACLWAQKDTGMGLTDYLCYRSLVVDNTKHRLPLRPDRKASPKPAASDCDTMRATSK